MRVVNSLSCRVGRMAVVLCMVVMPQVGNAQAHDEAAKRIYGSVMSPFCPGRLLSDCPSDQATQLKHQILDDLQAGKTEGSIIEGLEGRFGSVIRAMPQGTGMGLVAWVAPPLFFLFALVGGGFWISRKRTTAN
jgi:cytochrome c-type biogenesis protein CcmH/NrfF